MFEYFNFETACFSIQLIASAPIGYFRNLRLLMQCVVFWAATAWTDFKWVQ